MPEVLIKPRITLMTSETNQKDPSMLTSSKEKCKIIIIGAGIAGIAAASYLAKNGETDFKILEARDRIGGRIQTVSAGDGTVDLGAGWIHGVLGNPIYELARESGLVRMAGEPEPHAIVATTEEGKRVPIAVIEEVYGAYFWFSKRCEEYFLVRGSCPGVNSVGAHLHKDIEAYLQQFSDPEELAIRRLVFDHLLNREMCITGTHSMYEVGLASFGSYTELPGGNVTIPSGFSSLLDLLVQRLPSECILTDHCVQKICWKGRDTAEIECENGRLFATDHIVVTLPLGVLKEQSADLFEPPLPDYKLECIGRLSFGVVNKIYLEYSRPFLNPELSEILTLWSPSSTPESDLENSWFRKIYSFSRTGDRVLLAWVSGREAEVLETLSDDQVLTKCTELLRKFLADPYIPKPCRVFRSNWKNQPYSRGSYTSIGVYSSQDDIELLAKPIYSDPYQNKPVLLFAGEATHDTFYSTVHGAYLSGLRVSRLLLDSDETVTEESLSSWLKGIDLS